MRRSVTVHRGGRRERGEKYREAITQRHGGTKKYKEKTHKRTGKMPVPPGSNLINSGIISMDKLRTRKEFHVSEFKLVMALSEAADLICAELGMHQMQVAYIAVRIGEVLNLSGEQKNKLIMAGLLHDIGGLSLRERMDALHFEEDGNFYRHV